MQRKGIYRIVISPRKMTIHYFADNTFGKHQDVDLTVEEERLFDEIMDSIGSKKRYKMLTAETGEFTELTMLDKDRSVEILKVAEEIIDHEDKRFGFLYDDDKTEGSHN